MTHDTRCRCCRLVLISHDEIDAGVCSECIESLIERSRRRSEWTEYHDEPCPEIELAPMPGEKP